ncbi:integrase [Streptomyces sp. NPDC057011]|uniref:integrase n=1 Tax=unclassified Streptomyces TaxID=2593676 RepID=UPI0036366242
MIEGVESGLATVRTGVGVPRQIQRPEEYDEQTRAGLDYVDDIAAEKVAAGRPDNTVTAYAQDWKAWEKFCAEKQLPLLAIRSGTLVWFVEWLWEQPGRKAGSRTAPSTIDRRITGIVVSARVDHKLTLEHGVAKQARARLTQLKDELAKSPETRGRGKAPALKIPHLQLISAALPDNLRGLRDRALVLVHFALAGREHEIAWLRNRHITLTDEGLVVDVAVSKVKPRTVGIPYGTRLATCPVRNWVKYKEAVEELTGEPLNPDEFAFRRIHAKGKSLMAGGITPEAVGDVVTSAGEIAGIEIRFTGHSPRRGFATESVKKGKEREAKRQGGWAKASRAFEEYVEEGGLFEDNALHGIGL